MLTSLTKDIYDIDGARKTAIISRELVRLKVDIAALQETRIAGCGSLTEKEYTFFWLAEMKMSLEYMELVLLLATC